MYWGTYAPELENNALRVIVAPGDDDQFFFLKCRRYKVNEACYENNRSTSRFFLIFIATRKEKRNTGYPVSDMTSFDFIIFST